MSVKYGERGELLRRILGERIVFLDGGMGTLIQREGLEESDFRGSEKELLESKAVLKGNNDLLNITRPDVIEKLERAYFEAGADIVTTNTFGATRLIQAEYGLADIAKKINACAAKIATTLAREFEKRDGKPRFVAGSIGPMNKTASIPPNPDDTAARAVTFDELESSYREQMRALYEGGVDLFLLETSFDTLNVKAAIYAYLTLKDEISLDIPIAVSMTVSDLSGRILSGQTISAFYESIKHAEPLFVGLNCSLGAEKMRPYIEEFDRIAECYTHCYPNAGLPNPLSKFGYDQSPEEMARHLQAYAADGLLNVIGGCCGTTPEHIKAVVEACSKYPPRKPRQESEDMCLAGLEVLRLKKSGAPFVFVGERTNVMGSLAFKKMVREGRWQDAVSVAHAQVENGANAIDVNFDEAMLDSKSCMRTFLNMLAAEPEIARVPTMIDSSDWQTLLAGLKCVQGKGIVNSISLKEGEEAFLSKALEIKKFGFAILVMAFDEKGQAVTKEDKVRICKRSYDLLLSVGIKPQDIIFDANVLTVATGIPEHDAYAVNFIEAVREIKKLCPLARTSAGVSNISFAFRGNNPVREAMHSVFLYHARKAGLDFGIVNAGMLANYDDIEPELRDLVEAVILNKGHGAVEALLEKAESIKASASAVSHVRHDDFESLDWNEKLKRCFVKGLDDKIEAVTEHFYAELKDPLKVIEGPLMLAMKHVGNLFGEGKMFLPQVVKSARVMKKAVAVLDKYMSKDSSAKRGKVVIATVKGDVHDIGKNIVGSVLTCNGYELVDLGVMCEAEKILEAARDADLVGLSALITPSLNEMANVAKLFERENMNVPIIVGGASTSTLHTAVKLAPLYSGSIMRVEDASVVAEACSNLISDSGEFSRKLKESQRKLKEDFESSGGQAPQVLPYAQACQKKVALEFKKEDIAKPASFDLWLGDHSVEELEKFLSWNMLYSAWELEGASKGVEHEDARKNLLKDAQGELENLKKVARPKAVWRFFRANSKQNDIVLHRADDKVLGVLHFFRNQKPTNGACACAADFVAPRESGLTDCVGLFAATAGVEAQNYVESLKAQGDEYRSILAATLCNMLAEAYARYINEIKMRPFATCMGVRPACGYKMWGDHSEKATIWELLNVEKKTGIRLTENFMMYPPSSVCGLWLANPSAKYVNFVTIDKEQLADYEARKGGGNIRRYLSVDVVD